MNNGPTDNHIICDGEGQGSLACCSPRGCKESDMTEGLKTTNATGKHDSIIMFTCKVSGHISCTWQVQHKIQPF